MYNVSLTSISWYCILIKPKNGIIGTFTPKLVVGAGSRQTVSELSSIVGHSAVSENCLIWGGMLTLRNWVQIAAPYFIHSAPPSTASLPHLLTLSALASAPATLT